MDKIRNEYLNVDRFRTIPLKTLGVTLVSLVFILGLSACGANKPMSGYAKSKGLAKDLYPEKNTSLAHVRSNPDDKVKEADKQAIVQKVLKLQMPFIANRGYLP